MGSGAERHIVIDAHGKGIGLLEHHTHPLAQQVHVHIPVNVLPVQQHLSVNSAALHQIVHPVQGFEQRGLSAAGRTDKGSDLMGRNLQLHIFQRMKAAVVQVHVMNRKLIHPFLLLPQTSLPLPRTGS